MALERQISVTRNFQNSVIKTNYEQGAIAKFKKDLWKFMPKILETMRIASKTIIETKIGEILGRYFLSNNNKNTYIDIDRNLI